ncbi:hypothetical protein SAZ10_10435 [Mesorhizobium sp. BAC0120]|uniref:hypothetical protein n=1 Tax=Mesorhizobium sp. BAC0120 TaxID=3090670 RepID=UPI00298D3545|nr:hypothetical protein [Mesorhizobium sp. BAC0120]MDW6022176.1 hypothetical protein [Mesorhizobium sp. BAC0120]
MTRHRMVQPSAAGIQPSAADPRASMVILDAEGVASGRPPSRQYRTEAQRSGLSASIPALPDGGRAIDDTGRNPKSP